MIYKISPFPSLLKRGEKGRNGPLDYAKSQIMFSILFRKNRGLTLIELLIALVLSSILTAVLYRAFISQQKTYTVQDQVADMQQNVRIAMGQMAREIRMAGYGGNILSIFANVNGFTNIITPASNAITIILGDDVGVLKQNTPKDSN